MKKKSLALLMAVVMLFGATFAGVYAWLTDSTATVTNTFVEGKIEITLDETKVVDGQPTNVRTTANTYDIIPGTTYLKDPIVTVKDVSEKCYLFVKVEEVNNPKEYFDYELNLDGWTKLGDAYAGVYYRVVDDLDTDQSWYLLTGNTTYPNGYITVKDTVTQGEQGNMSAAAAAELKWTAYAVQFANFNDAVTAWTSTFGATTNP